MKVVPLKGKLIDFVCPRYKEDITFKIKVFEPDTVAKFHELHKQAHTIDGAELFDVHLKLIDIGVDCWVDGEGVEHRDEPLKLEWFNIVALSDQVVKSNCYTIDNVKK